MKRIFGYFLIMVLVGVSGLFAANTSAANGSDASSKGVASAPLSGKLIPNQYIVVLKDGANARSVAAVAGVSPKTVYQSALNGFAATLNQGQLNALSKNPNVDFIEQDQAVQLSTTQLNATWGIDRIDQAGLPLSGSYTYSSTGAGVTAYVIDTGIATGNGEFGGRAQNVFDSFGGNGSDCNGHGTHVAGTIGGTSYGVAKAVSLRGVRVLDCNGSGTWSGVIAGMDWVRSNAVKPAVANMSLGGGKSRSVNTAASNLAKSGVFLAVAAGNDNQNACNSSPASANDVLTTAASTNTDAKASFSNYGSCVEVYAPGVNITSAWLSGNKTISGTSMASPHVAGVGALYKATFGDASSATVSNWIINNASSGVISGNPSRTPNLLLNKGGL